MKGLTGRPRLAIPLEDIVREVWATGNQTHAAANLGGS